MICRRLGKKSKVERVDAEFIDKTVVIAHCWPVHVLQEYPDLYYAEADVVDGEDMNGRPRKVVMRDPANDPTSLPREVQVLTKTKRVAVHKKIEIDTSDDHIAAEQGANAWEAARESLNIHAEDYLSGMC